MNIILDPENINWSQVKRFAFFCLAIILSIVFFANLYKALLVPICISLFLTYLLLPVIHHLDRLKVPRVVSVSLLLLATLAAITFAIFKIIPPLYLELVSILKLAPKTYETFAREWLPPVRDQLLSWDVITVEEWNNFIRESKNLTHLSDRVNQALSTIWHTAPQVLGTVINIVMVPLITFCLLKDYEEIKARLLQLIPRDLLRPFRIFSFRVSEALRAVIRGQAMVAGILAVLYILGLSIVGLQASFVIGLIAGACRIINYLDVIVGGTLSLMVILSDFRGIGQLLAVAGVFLVVQSIDGMFITPRVIGDRVGLHPVLVIVSILSFGDLFGFWGVLLAIPVLAVAKVLWFSAKPFYIASKPYVGTQSPPKPLDPYEQEEDTTTN
ncbi:MAG: AI-2E family transporter [Oligoflexales bacterium]